MIARAGELAPDGGIFKSFSGVHPRVNAAGQVAFQVATTSYTYALFLWSNKQLIQLAYFGGKTYRQVAEVLGIPEGTAKSRLRLGLRRIAGVLETETVARSE